MNTRRDFLKGTAWMGAATLAGGCMTDGLRPGGGGVDENLSVLISDLHISGTNPKWQYTNARLNRVVDEILERSPRPRRVICFGDVARSFGLAADYAAAKPILQRLVDAGIDLHLTMGNHDRRSNFYKYWPEYLDSPLVSGRMTQVISLGHADLVLLDTLKGTDDRAEDDMGPVEGTIDSAQLQWFENFVATAKRPFFIGSHQFRDLYIDGKKPIARAAESPHFVGWLFGHDHEFTTQMVVADWKTGKIVQTFVLPSTGLWGDIGYVTMRTDVRSAELNLFQDDFYFTTPRPAAERPAAWDARVLDNRGRRVRFAFDSAGRLTTQHTRA